MVYNNNNNSNNQDNLTLSDGNQANKTVNISPSKLELGQEDERKGRKEEEEDKENTYSPNTPQPHYNQFNSLYYRWSIALHNQYAALSISNIATNHHNANNQSKISKICNNLVYYTARLFLYRFIWLLAALLVLYLHSEYLAVDGVNSLHKASSGYNYPNNQQKAANNPTNIDITDIPVHSNVISNIDLPSAPSALYNSLLANRNPANSYYTINPYSSFNDSFQHLNQFESQLASIEAAIDQEFAQSRLAEFVSFQPSNIQNSILNYPEITQFESIIGGNIYLVTACSSLYFQRLLNLIGSFYMYEPKQLIIVYDIGLAKEQQEMLLSRTLTNVIYRKLPFENYPLHVQNLWNYAWKIMMIDDLLKSPELNAKAMIIMDAGIEVRKLNSLSSVKLSLLKNGFWAPQQSNFIDKKTSILTLNYLNITIESIRSKPFCAGGLNAFLLDKKAPIYSKVLAPAIECALIEECIAPSEGIGRSRHNYDQSVLSALIYSSGYSCSATRIYREWNMGKVTSNSELYRENNIAISLRRWHQPKPFIKFIQQQALMTNWNNGLFIYTNKYYEYLMGLNAIQSLDLSSLDSTKNILIEQTYASYIEQTSELNLCLQKNKNQRGPCIEEIKAHFSKMKDNQASAEVRYTVLSVFYLDELANYISHMASHNYIIYIPLLLLILTDSLFLLKYCWVRKPTNSIIDHQLNNADENGKVLGAVNFLRSCVTFSLQKIRELYLEMCRWKNCSYSTQTLLLAIGSFMVLLVACYLDYYYLGIHSAAFWGSNSEKLYTDSIYAKYFTSKYQPIPVTISGKTVVPVDNIPNCNLNDWDCVEGIDWKPAQRIIVSFNLILTAETDLALLGQDITATFNYLAQQAKANSIPIAAIYIHCIKFIYSHSNLHYSIQPIDLALPNNRDLPSVLHIQQYKSFPLILTTINPAICKTLFLCSVENIMNQESSGAPTVISMSFHSEYSYYAKSNSRNLYNLIWSTEYNLLHELEPAVYGSHGFAFRFHDAKRKIFNEVYLFNSYFDSDYQRVDVLQTNCIGCFVVYPLHIFKSLALVNSSVASQFLTPTKLQNRHRSLTNFHSYYFEMNFAGYLASLAADSLQSRLPHAVAQVLLLPSRRIYHEQANPDYSANEVLTGLEKMLLIRSIEQALSFQWRNERIHLLSSYELYH
jgi:hypothetical protein